MCPARAFYETTLVDGCHTVSRSGCRITDDAGEVDAQGIARSDQVCFTLDNGPSRLRLACPFCAISGRRSRGLLDQIAGVARPDGASLWKSCFAEAVDIHLSLPLTGMGYPFRYSEMGLNLKELGHRLPSFCISP
jgi:hypothetical protein